MKQLARLLPSRLKRAVQHAASYRRFMSDFQRFQQLSQADDRFPCNWCDRYPVLADRTSATGFDRHYVYHTSWAARVLARSRPEYHVDISSSLFFCGLVSAFVPVRFYDYRPADLRLSGLESHAGDLLALPFADNSVPSLSCMHVVEHVGLGRYGDPIDPGGDLKAIAELQRVLRPGASSLFVVPVGRPAIRFNAHRIYSHAQVVDAHDKCDLVEFALVPDDAADGGLIHEASAQQVAEQEYGCGCFLFKKR